MIKEIFSIFQLIHFTILLKSNFTLYLIVVIGIILLIFLTTILVVVMAYRIKLKKKKIKWGITILRYCLPLFSFGFHGQIYLMFTTIFYCRKSESQTSPYLKCRPGHWFTEIKPIAGIAMFLHFLISFITNTLYYKPIFLKCNSDLLKKSNSLPDIIFLFSKMIIITIFILDKGVESEHWAILSFLVLVTGTNAYFTVFYENRTNEVLLALNNFFCLVLFSGFLILFIGKIFKSLGFDGSIFLFFSCSILIIIYIIFFKRNEMVYNSKNYKNITSPDEYLQYVTRFYNIIKNKNNSRYYSINLKSLILSIEEYCTEINCPLKKYLLNLENGFDCEYLLLQFCEKLFQYGISKFNGNIFLKNHYSIFLITYMNNRKKALIILDSIKDEITSLQTKYNIYRCRRIIENYCSPFINKNNSIIEYRSKAQEFKNYIEKSALLYYQFLSILLDNKAQIINGLENMNKLGHQILKLNKKAEDIFTELINTKTDNIEIIKIYSEFSENILKNEEKNENLDKLKKTIYKHNMNDCHDNDYSNFDIQLLKEDPNSNYLIISSKNKNLGIIIDCSMNLCSIFGHQKKELIGRHIDILIPEIFRQKHNLLIEQKTEINKLNFLEGLCQNEIYSPNFIQKDIFSLLKSKLLIPLNIKIYLVNTEENELVYITEITKNEPVKNDLIKKMNDHTKYSILTDQKFLIQSFTPNCIKYLNINYEDISCNYNIINYIKQFHEDYFNTINNSNSRINSSVILSMNGSKHLLEKKENKNNKLSNQEKQKIKIDIFNKKFSKKCKITWKSSEKNNFTIIEKENIRSSSSIFAERDNISFDNKFLSDNSMDLYMETKKIILDNELIGYIFNFSKIFNYKNNCYLNYKTVKNEDSVKNMKIKKSKKYQCKFKSFNNSESNFNKVIHNLKRRTKRNSLEKIILKEKLNEEFKNSNNFSPEKIEKKVAKSSSTNEIPDIKKDEDIIIDENFIPSSNINFAFNIKNISYKYSKKKNNEKILNEEVKNLSMEIINLYEKLKIKNNEESNSKSFLSSKDAPNTEEEEFSSSNSNSISGSSLKFEESISKDNNKKPKIIENTPNENIKENIKNDSKDNINILNKIHKRNSSSLNNYYKVDLNNIRLLIYDFNKEAIIEEDYKKISKIENIIINSKKEISIGKDEKYPFVSFKHNNKEKKISHKDEKIKEMNYNFNQKSDINSSRKKMEKKILEEINNHKDEQSIKQLKNVSLLSYIILVICGIVTIYLSLNFYSLIKELFKLFFSSLNIKQYETISTYYARELSLLNFNESGIIGGEYTKIPAKNRDKYISLIKEQLSELFIENQSLIKQLLSSKIDPSKNDIKDYIESILESNISLNEDEEINNVFTLLIQYNNDLYNLAFNNNNQIPLQSQLYDYIYNCLNNYKIGLNILIIIYNQEFNQNKKKVKIFLIIILIIIFFIYIIIYITLIIYFSSANKTRIKFMKIFYNISSNVLKNLMIDSLYFINKMKESREKNNMKDDEEINNTLEENNSSINIKKKDKENSTLNSIIIKNQKIKEHNISINNNLFIIIFCFALLLFYSYFVYNSIFLFSLIKKVETFFEFGNLFQNYQNKVIEMFNIYREFLFDNETKILNINSLEYLRNLEDEFYSEITEHNIKTDTFIQKIIMKHLELIPELTVEYCSHNVTGYYNSLEECHSKSGTIIKYDYRTINNYFLEEIKVQKNIARYLFQHEKIKFNLTNFNRTNFINEFQKDKTIEFRLNLFNNETLHFNLNLLFINSILPHFRHNKGIIYNYISIDGEKNFLILLIIIYLLILSFIFFLFFNLIIKILNDQVFKAKNMLSIVPISILTYQNNNESFLSLFVNK